MAFVVYMIFPDRISIIIKLGYMLLPAPSFSPDTPSMLMNSTSSTPFARISTNICIQLVFLFRFADPQPQHILYTVYIIAQNDIYRTVVCFHLFAYGNVNTVDKKECAELFQWTVLPFLCSSDYPVRNC